MNFGFRQVPGVLLVLAMLTAGARADEPRASHLAAARELMATTGVLSPVDDLVPTFTDQIRKQTVTRPELSKDLEEVLKSLEPEFKLQREQITTIVSRTYAKWLSEAEMKEVTAFFKTPVGAKFNKIQPDLVEDVVNDVQVWTQQASEYVMVRVRAELAKRGQSLQ